MDTVLSPFAFVETTNGEQEFFETPYAAFRHAKQQEERKRNSVEYVAVGSFYGDEETEGRVYRGQHLRYILRSLDDVQGWLKAQLEVELDDPEEE